MPFKTKDQNKINFLIGDNKLTKNNKEAEAVIKENKAPGTRELEDVLEQQKSRKLNSKDDGYKSSRDVCSARLGNILDINGPSKYIKGEMSNTIWESNKIGGLTKQEDEKDIAKTGEIKNVKEETREVEDSSQTLGSMQKPETANIIPLREASPVSAQILRPLKNNMSIFDNEDFERLSDKTAGEKLSEDLKVRKSQKDESWKTGGKCFSSKDLLKNLFNKGK